MAQSEKKVVWILGAGFSVPLGGPLFRELISPRTLRRLRTWEEFAEQKVSLEVHSDVNGPGRRDFDPVILAGIVEHLYRSGVETNVWSDAEQFLDMLGIATFEDDKPLADDIRTMIVEVFDSGEEPPDAETIELFKGPRGLEDLYNEAVRFVAGACTVFLVKAENDPTFVRESELWSPYCRWVQRLSAGDSVVTFNYDRVLNLLNRHIEEFNAKVACKVPTLHSPVGCDADFTNSLSGQVVPMYHLHGHVGWQRGLSGDVQCGRDEPGLRNDPARAHIDPSKALLGLPGKRKTSLPTGALKNCWEQAMGAIGTATSVVFVGYRFPETDNLAKQQLADALRQNPKARVHVVLGAENDDTPRLKGIIGWTRNGSSQCGPTLIHQMWCQDFFAVFERNKL